MRLLSGSIIAEEEKLEQDAIVAGVARYHRLIADATKRQAGASLRPGQRLLLSWFLHIKAGISAEKGLCTKGTPGASRGIYGPVLQLLDSDRLAVLTMHTVLSMCLAEPTGLTTMKIVFAIARAANAQLDNDIIAKARGTLRNAFDRSRRYQRDKQQPRNILRISRKYIPTEVWPLRVQARLGACLLHILIRHATVGKGEKTPAFERKIERIGHKTPAFVTLHAATARIIEDEHRARERQFPRYQPMVIRPLLWAERARGGFLKHQMPLVKGTRLNIMRRVPVAVRHAVNALNGAPWRINGRIAEVAKRLWEQGGNVAGIPRRDNIPPPPPIGDWDNLERKKAWKRAAFKIHMANRDLKAERFVFLAKLSLAERYKKYARFYFPHQLDFRGRAYPVPLFLNYQGDDVCRGLLEFAQSKPADGEDAQGWLHVHFANCCGMDKLAFDQRVQWSRDHTEREKWAADPLKYPGWMDQDRPFQALAAAMALADPDAASRLPVAVDGSNNALQHYAAMLRCEETAALVNVLPGDMPADVYADVADMAARYAAADAESGHALAASLDGYIRRKIIKQTAMTVVYGVTHVGARRQIYTQLKAAGFDETNLYEASKYLGATVRRCMGELCPGAARAMQWLRDCARIISTGRPRPDKGKPLKGHAVSWTTPLNLRVTQPYRRLSRLRVDTILHRFLANYRDEKCPVSPQRQANAHAPNFVHGLDASHMFLVVNECHEAGVDFAAAHDAYVTHAATMTMLRSIVPEQFLVIHKEPLLDDLYTQFHTHYPNLDFPPPPTTGGLDLPAVLHSPYFFS